MTRNRYTFIMAIIRKILATIAFCFAAVGLSSGATVIDTGSTLDNEGKPITAFHPKQGFRLENANHGHASALDKFTRDYVNDVLRIREEQYAVGDHTKSRKEMDREQIFTNQVQNYIAGIGQLSTLEYLCNSLWLAGIPEDMPISLWTEAEENIKCFLCERLAKFGTQEAYESLSRLRAAYSDGAWCGLFRSLEWKYLRQYSKDPVVLKSKLGIFH